MAKWRNWFVWGITYPFLGAIVSAILAFLTITNFANTISPQLAFLGILPKFAFAAVGVIGAILFFIFTITVSIIFWLIAGAFSLVTTPVLMRYRHGSSVNLIFVPWLLLAIIAILLNLGVSVVMPNASSGLPQIVEGFVVSVIINYVFIWISVWMNGLFKAQSFLPG